MGTERQDPERIDRALSLIAKALSKNAAKADEILKEEGTDISDSIAKNLAFVKKMQGKAKLRAAAEERKRSGPRLAKLRQAAREKLREVSDDPKRALSKLLREVSPDFRNIEEMNHEDVIDALEQAELLKLLEQLETGEE